MTIITCPTGQQPVIKWTYPNESQQEAYANEHDAIGAYDFSRWSFSVRSNSTSSASTYNIGPNLYEFSGKAKIWKDSTGRNSLIVECKNREVDEYFAQRYNRTPPSQPAYQIECNAANPGFIVVEYGRYSIFNDGYIQSQNLIQFISYQPVVQDITFLVKNNGSPVYSRTSNTIPAIATECRANQCPPDTCEVECGSTICCYNSQGISVFNFPKP